MPCLAKGPSSPGPSPAVAKSRFLQERVPPELLQAASPSAAHPYLKVRLLVGDRDRQHEDPELDLLREQ